MASSVVADIWGAVLCFTGVKSAWGWISGPLASRVFMPTAARVYEAKSKQAISKETANNIDSQSVSCKRITGLRCSPRLDMHKKHACPIDELSVSR